MSSMPEGFAAKLERVRWALEKDHGFIGRLEAVAALARRVIADCDGAGISAVAHGRAWSVAASDDVVLEVDLVQYDTGEGPCLDAIRRAQAIRLDVARSTDTYPHFAPGAIDAGIQSVLSTPAVRDGHVVGALNLYSQSAGVFDDGEAASLAEKFAAYAAETIVTSPLYAYSIDLVNEVVEGLGTAEMVGEAVGIMCARVGYGRDEALADLAESARLRGESLRDAAEWVIRERHVSSSCSEDAAGADGPMLDSDDHDQDGKT